jgi:alpha-L-fucosidase
VESSWVEARGRCAIKHKKAFQVEDTRQATHQASKRGQRRFQKETLGLSVHWGLYSLSIGGDEWVYFKKQISFKKYQQRMEQFKALRFNAQEWADLMVEAGMKFLVITSKHHDGFCLWDSQLTGFKVTNTPLGRDILAELAEALHSRGLGLHFYY